MTVTLYNYVLSGNCYKVRLLASLLDVPINCVAVDFHPGKEHRSEAMLKLNSAGTLPIFTVGDLVLTETQAMLVWLAQHHDKTHCWWPANDSDQLVRVIQWLGFSSRLTATVGELRMHSMLNKNINVPAATTGSQKALRELESHLTEQRLRGCQWLAGNHPTIADIACFPYTALSPDAGIEHDAYPALRRWLHGIRSLAGFVTMPGIHELHELKNTERVQSE